MNNITCPACRFRHPPNVTCEQAKRQAALNRLKRDIQSQAAETADYTFILNTYQEATNAVDQVLGSGAAMRIITLMECWKALGEANAD